MSTLLNLNDSNKEYYNTVMGNPVTVDDAIADEIRDMTVIIEPTQSGSGDPSPTNIRPISGVSSVSVTRTGKNLLEITAQSASVNGVTYTVNRDAAGNVLGITANGTASGLSVFDLTGIVNQPAPQDYIFSGCASRFVNNTNVTLRIRKEVTGAQFISAGNGASVPAGTNMHSFCIVAVSGVTFNNDTFYPMLRRAADTDPTFEPYQGQTVTVQLTDGSNPLTVYGGALNVTTGKLTMTHALVELQTLTVAKLSATAGYEHNFVLTKNSDPSSGGSPETWVCSHYTPMDADWLQMPSMSFKILTGNTLRIDILDSRYTEISDMNTFLTAQKQAGTPVQVLYPLASPLTYQLAPEQLTTLLGYNTVSTSAAQISLTYRFDPTNIAIPE